MPEDTPSPYITLNARGVPCLDGTRHRVIDLVADHVAYGDRAAHIVEPSPDLTPAHVYSALAYMDVSVKAAITAQCCRMSEGKTLGVACVCASTWREEKRQDGRSRPRSFGG